MTDQKIDTSKEAVERHITNMLIRTPDADMLEANEELLRALLTELDRLKAELAQETSWKDAYKHDLELAEKKLKSSGTFSDGVEAAAKWHDEVARNMQYRINNARGTVSHTFTGEMQRHKEHAAAIRALSPESILEQMEKNQP